MRLFAVESGAPGTQHRARRRRASCLALTWARSDDGSGYLGLAEPRLTEHGSPYHGRGNATVARVSMSLG